MPDTIVDGVADSVVVPMEDDLAALAGDMASDPFSTATKLMYELRDQVKDLQQALEVEKEKRSQQVDTLQGVIGKEVLNRERACQEISQALSHGMCRVEGDADRTRRRLGDFDRALLKEIQDRTVRCDNISETLKQGLEDLSAAVEQVTAHREEQTSSFTTALASEVESRKGALDELENRMREERSVLRSDLLSAHSKLNRSLEVHCEDYDKTKGHTQTLLTDVQWIAGHLQGVSRNWGALRDLKLTCVDPDAPNRSKEGRLQPHPPDTPSTMRGSSPLTSLRCSPDRPLTSSPVEMN
jgi:hypothetical protein